MIISLQEDYDKELGTSLPMISRAGKKSINHHLCFANALSAKKDQNFESNLTQEPRKTKILNQI